MKHGKAPTKAQKEFIYSKGKNPNEWLVVKDTSEEMLLMSRWFGKKDKRIIKLNKEKTQ